MQSSTISVRQFVDEAMALEESSQSRVYQSSTSLHAPLVSSQQYFQQLQRMLRPDALQGVELSHCNKFQIGSADQLATSGFPTFDASPSFTTDYAAVDARAHLTKLFAAGWELDSGEVVPFTPDTQAEGEQAEPSATARQFDLKPVKEKERKTQSWIEWDKQDPRQQKLTGESILHSAADDCCLRDESAWFAAGACTENTVALLRPRQKERQDIVNRTSGRYSTKRMPEISSPLHPENRLSSRRADAHMRLRHVQVIDQSSLQQVLQDAREREVERLAARGQDWQHGALVRQCQPLASIVANVRSQAKQLLTKLRMYFS